MSKIIVTGGAGFLGAHLVPALEALGHDVYNVDNLSGGYMRNVKNKEKFTKLDLRNRIETEAYINKIRPEIIFHLAADATEGRSQFTPFSAIDNNLVAYMNLLVPAINCGLKKMVMCSSMSVYGAQRPPFTEEMDPKPEDVYASAKASMETVTKVLGSVHGFDWVIIRPHNIYGRYQNLADPYRNVIGIFINRLLNGKPFYIYGDGKQTRAFSHVNDVVPNMVMAGFKEECVGKVINIGGEVSYQINELADIILEEFFDGNVPDEFKPLYLPDRPQEVKHAFCDHMLAKELINFEQSVSLKDGIRDMVQWARGMGPQEFVYLDKLDIENEKTPRSWVDKLF